MWRPDFGLPLLRRRPKFILCMGQSQLQLWRDQGERPERVTCADVSQLGHHQSEALRQQLAAMIHELPVGAVLTVLMDSKWMPVTLLATGKRPLQSAQIDALCRHRFTMLFGDQAQHWPSRSNYLPGDEQALAFALIPAIQDALQQACQNAQGKGVTIGSIQPTFSWLLDASRFIVRDRASRWVACAEQDRTIFALLAKQGVVALHACGPRLLALGDVLNTLQKAALQAGMPDKPQEVMVLSVEPRPDMTMVSPSAGVTWLAIGREAVST